MQKNAALTFLFILTATTLLAPPSPAQAWEEESRTNNRTPSGAVLYPQWVFDRPEHYEFLPLTSNHDAQNDHSAQWQGQDWDTTQWNKAQWTPEIAVNQFFAAGIFARQYLREGTSGAIWTPVLEVGPRFYQLSALDQRRCLKLMADYTNVFGNNYSLIDLRDWHTRKSIGHYTPQGLYLN